MRAAGRWAHSGSQGLLLRSSSRADPAGRLARCAAGIQHLCDGSKQPAEGYKLVSENTKQT